MMWWTFVANSSVSVSTPASFWQTDRLYGFTLWMHVSPFLICTTLTGTLALTLSIRATWAVGRCVWLCWGGGSYSRWVVVRQLMSEAVKWWVRWHLKVYVLRVLMNTDSSQSREIAGQPSRLWLVQQWRVGVCLSVFSVHSSGLTSLAVLRWLAGFGAQATRSVGGSFVSSSSLELFSTKQFPEHRGSGMDKLTQFNSELLITSRGTAEESHFGEKQQGK